MIRPSRHPCSSPTGASGLAPAPTARLNIASGSSTTSRVRPVAPPIPSGLNRLRVESAAATQNAAPSTESWATMSSPSPTRCSTVAPNAAW